MGHHFYLINGNAIYRTQKEIETQKNITLFFQLFEIPLQYI